MNVSDDVLADLMRQLRKVEGQVRGIQQMLADQRDCRDVVTQISAASKELDQAGFLLVAATSAGHRFDYLGKSQSPPPSSPSPHSPRSPAW